MAIKTVTCPRCGKTLQTDDSMEKTFCLYCGSPIYSEPKKEEILLGAIDTNAGSSLQQENNSQPVTPLQPGVTPTGMDIPINQMTYAQLMEQGQKLQQQALEQAMPFVKAQSNNYAKEVGVLYSEATEEEKKNPEKLSFGKAMKAMINGDKLFWILATIALVFLSVGLIVLTAAFRLVAIGIVISVLFLGATMFALIKSIGRRRCNKCKTDLKIADVEYEHLYNVKKDNGKGGKTKYKRYRFKIKCPVCGKEKVFDEDIVVNGGHIDLNAVVGRKDNEKATVGKHKLPIILLWGGLALIGLIFLIIGAVVMTRHPVNIDPEDYYGTYKVTDYGENFEGYSEKELQTYFGTDDLMSLSITEDKVTFGGYIAESNHINGTFSYEYALAESVDKKISYPVYKDKNVLFVDIGNSQVIVLYILSTSPYTFEIGNTKIVMQSTAPVNTNSNTGDGSLTNNTGTGKSGSSTNDTNTGKGGSSTNNGNPSTNVAGTRYTITSIDISYSESSLELFDECRGEPGYDDAINEAYRQLSTLQSTLDTEYLSSTIILKDDGTCEIVEEEYTWEKIGSNYVFTNVNTGKESQGSVVWGVLVISIEDYMDVFDLTISLQKQ